MGRIYRLFALLILISTIFSNLDARQIVAATNWQEKVDPWILNQAADAQVEFLVYLAEQADLSPADQLPTKLEKTTYVYQTLSRLAAQTQAPLIRSR